MTPSFRQMKRCSVSALMLISLALGAGCARVSVHTGSLPPILTQHELNRPYDELGVVSVRRDRTGAPTDISPADYTWAYDALRSEASKIGADAVIYPEVNISVEQYYVVFPTSHVSAKGIAIKFR